MKKVLLALLIVGCQSAEKPTTASPPTQAEKDHASIKAYLQETLDDPASYAPVSFDDYAKFSRADSALWQFELRHGDVDRTANEAAEADTVTSVGRWYIHKFRAKNKAGGLELMKKYFAVYKNGKIETYTP